MVDGLFLLIGKYSIVFINNQLESINHLLDGLVPFGHAFEIGTATMLVMGFKCPKARGNEFSQCLIGVPYFHNGKVILVAPVLLGLFGDTSKNMCVK